MGQTAEAGTVTQFDQVHQRIKQLQQQAHAAKKRGDFKTSQEFLIQAWKLKILDIETRKS